MQTVEEVVYSLGEAERSAEVHSPEKQLHLRHLSVGQRAAVVLAVLVCIV